MKYCNRFYDYIYFDHYNGNMFICPWMDPKTSSIGNIIEQDFDEIWHGEKAERLRDLGRRGDFSHCRGVACPHLQNDDLPDKEPGDSAWETRSTPREINLAFDFICNISCPTCRGEVFVPDKDYARNLDKIVEKVIPLASKADKLTASGHGDPFASPYMMRVLENLHPENKDYEIMLETNGIFLDEAHWERIQHLGEYNLQIIMTTNSYHEPIYQQISRGGNLERLKKNQLFLKELRKANKVKHTSNGIVIQEKNYWEIPEFIEKSLNVYGFDAVVLKPVYNWGNLTTEEYWFKDVLNPLHPYNAEYQRIINLPIVKDNPRVYNFGGETMHEPAPMPGGIQPEDAREQAYAKLFRQWIGNPPAGERIADFVKNGGYRKVFIYGAAEVGQAVARALGDDGVVAGFIDRFLCRDCVDGLPVYRPEDDAIKAADMIIVTTVHIFDVIQSDLCEMGCGADMISIADMI